MKFGQQINNLCAKLRDTKPMCFDECGIPHWEVITREWQIYHSPLSTYVVDCINMLTFSVKPDGTVTDNPSDLFCQIVSQDFQAIIDDMAKKATKLCNNTAKFHP
jgi:hypothetical protein